MAIAIHCRSVSEVLQWHSRSESEQQIYFFKAEAAPFAVSAVFCSLPTCSVSKTTICQAQTGWSSRFRKSHGSTGCGFKSKLATALMTLEVTRVKPSPPAVVSASSSGAWSPSASVSSAEPGSFWDLPLFFASFFCASTCNTQTLGFSRRLQGMNQNS